jgi:hypothetical protein
MAVCVPDEIESALLHFSRGCTNIVRIEREAVVCALGAWRQIGYGDDL